MTPLIPITSTFTPSTEGAFRIDAATYHAAPGVSQSMLKTLAKSPAHLKCEMETPREETPAMILGTLLHTALFEPHKLAGSYCVKPDGHDGRTTEGKAWAAKHKGLTTISAKDATALCQMGITINAHPRTSEVIDCIGESELSLFRKDDVTGHLMKARPDRIVRAEDGRVFIVDVKSTTDASQFAFAKTVADFAYHRQAAYYTDMLAAFAVTVADFWFIAVEKAPPYAVGFYNIEPEDVERGRVANRRDLDVYAQCCEQNAWPGYPTELRTIRLPEWARRVA